MRQSLTVCTVRFGYRQEGVRSDNPAGAGRFVTGEKHPVHLPRLVEAGIRHRRVFDEVSDNPLEHRPEHIGRDIARIIDRARGELLPAMRVLLQTLLLADFPYD